MAGALAAAAAVVAVLAAPALVRPLLERDSGLVSLVESVGEQRSVLGRLTGGFPHAPLGGPSAGGQDGRAAGTDRVQLTAGRIRESFGERETPSQLHVRGVSRLLAGDYEDAVQSLLAASREQPANARYLSDVAAVQLERARLGLRPDDLPRALAAADRALRLDPSLKEAWFNRALAASALSLTAEAKSAWTEYLKRDSASPWAGEARQRLDELARPTRADAWVAIEGRLQSAFDASTADEAVRTQTTEARNFIENTLLVNWANAVIAGDNGGAELERVRTMAHALLRVAGDGLYVETVNAIDRAAVNGAGKLGQLAQAHKEYATASAIFAEDRFAASMPGLAAARTRFAAASSAFELRPMIDLGAVAYVTGRAADANALFDAVLASPSARNSFVAARATWFKGLIAFAQGRLAETQVFYEETLAAFDRMGDVEQAANAHNLLATLANYLGDAATAWRHWLRAFEALPASQSMRFKYGLLATTASATRATDPAAALLLQDVALSTAKDWRRDSAIAESMAQRAATLVALGRESEAGDDLEGARETLSRVPDPQFRSRIEVVLLSAQSDLERRRNPAAAVAAASRAIEIVHQRRDRLRLAQLHLRLAKANIVWGRLNDADAALARGIREFDEERASISDEGRISTLDESWGLYDVAVHLAIRKGDLPRAFVMAERARARTLAEFRRIAEVRTLAEVERSLGSDEAILAFNQFDDELAIWLIKSSGTTVSMRSLSRDDSERLVERQRAEINLQSAVADGSGALYNELIRPLSAHLRGVTRLTVVPDGPAQTASFAALWNPATRRFLVEDIALTHATSVNGAVTIGDQPARGGDPLVLAGPEADSNGRGVAAAYRNAELISGAAATPSRFLERAGESAIIHIAAPVAENVAYPLLSRVMLADAPGRRHSGAVLGREIVARQMPATSLVVIEQIQPSGTTRSDGTLGMARSFMAAGVPTVLGTLPGADETVTREMMVGFHELVASGQTAVDALSTLQRNAIQQNGRRLGAWTALVLYGSDR
ncbi:MAG TPA: CHAT domain-containing protein [Vicinamibacterales bacterium]